MSVIADNLRLLKSQVPETVTLVAVSKTKPVSDILEAYEAGQKVFGENKAQELAAKHESLPKDIQWHMIGHLQRNKVKYIAPFVALIHSVENESLLEEIDKQALKNQRVIDCLLQIHIAREETKFGMDARQAESLLKSPPPNINIRGLMGIATYTDDTEIINSEFAALKALFDKLKPYGRMEILSMGMSGDYKLAIAHGSNMIRVGSAIFGSR